MTNRLLVSPAEAANLLSVGRSTLYVLMQSGELASLPVGGSRRNPIATRDELVNRLRAADPKNWPRRKGNVSA
jgi:excisionase family DNA binding protein